MSVLYFAGLRERRGRAEERVDVAAGETAGALFRRLFPDWVGTVAFAVNRARVPADAPIGDGDEVAFLPPLGGG